MCVLGLLVLSGLAGGDAPAQRPELLEGSGKLAEYYPPPNQTRMKWFLEWARGRSAPDNQLLITEPKLQTFGVQGELTLAVRAPQCGFDRSRGTLSSSGPMQAQLADGKFSIAGTGFLWRQTNSDLFISNNVRSELHPNLMSRTPAEAGPAKGPVVIVSRQFQYSTNYGRAVWRGDVRLKGEQIALSSGVLEALLPSGQGGLQSLVAPAAEAPAQRQGQDRPSNQARVQSITAEQNVIVDYAGVQGTGEQAVYTPDTDELRLSGHPTWRAQSREGSADQLVLERTNQVLRAAGHGILKMPGQGLANLGLLSPGRPAATNAAPAKDQVLEVLSQSYVMRTNLAEFAGPVQAVEQAGGEVRGTLSCGSLTVGLGPTNQLERMVAEGNVIIAQLDRRFLAGKAVYEGATGVTELTQEPLWQAGARQGRGDLLRLLSQPEEMQVRGNAVMRLPAEELALAGAAPHGPSASPAVASADGLAPAAASDPPAAKPAGTNSPFAEVSAEEYTVTPGGAVFKRHARIKHPQMNWASETITVEWPEGQGTRRILAEGAAWFELLGQNNRKLVGYGDRADYTSSVTNGVTNEVMVLTGTPAQLVLERTPPDLTVAFNPTEFDLPRNAAESKSELGYIEDTLITLDRTHNRIRTSRNRQWAIHLAAPPANTNEVTKFGSKRKYDERRMGLP